MKLISKASYNENGMCDGMNLYEHKNGTKVYAANIKDARLRYKAGLTENNTYSYHPAYLRK